MLNYRLLGHPVNHSLSPIIHHLFASQFNLNINYVAQDVVLEALPVVLKQFRAQGGLGANITAPLKEAVYKMCDKKSIAAQRSQAVNTIYWDEDGALWGENTDGVGFLKDLKKHYKNIRDKTILMLGAGGAAAGIMPSILDENPHVIYVVNRTEQRAINLVGTINNNKLQVCSLEKLKQAPFDISFDIIINATSGSLKDELFSIPPSIIKNKFVYDLVYNLKQPTPFVQWAREEGALEAHDGLGMLIEQAAQAFYVWHQKRPDTQKVYVFFRPH